MNGKKTVRRKAGIKETGKVTVVIARHSGPYDNDRTCQSETAGSLKKEGKEAARRVAYERLVRTPKEERQKTDYLICASPTLWMDMIGQRAMQTGEEIINEFRQMLLQSGYTEQEASQYILNLQNYKIGGSVVPDNRLKEPNTYGLARNYIKKVVERYGGYTKEFYENFLKGREMKDENPNAENEEDVAKRVNESVNEAFLLGQRYMKKTRRNITIILITHGEVLRSYLEQYEKTVRDYEGNYNDGIVMEYTAYKAKDKVWKKYKRHGDFSAHMERDGQEGEEIDFM